MAEVKPWDGASEMGGVYAGEGDYKRWISITEGPNGVCVRAIDANVVMSVQNARSLARQIYRLARRVESHK